MIKAIKKFFNIRPSQEETYLIYGIEDIDLDIDKDRYSFFIAQKCRNKSWNSLCGKTIVDVTYIEPLFNQPERSKREDRFTCEKCSGDVMIDTYTNSSRIISSRRICKNGCGALNTADNVVSHK